MNVQNRVMRNGRRTTTRGTAQTVSAAIEPLEQRTFLSAAPVTPFKAKASPPTQVLKVWMDNRGGVVLTTSYALDAATLSRKSAAIYTAGNDAVIGTADDVRQYTAVGYRKGTMSLRATLPVNTPYRVILNAAVVKGVYGRAIDGEFKGQGVASGNGAAGGNFDVVTKAPKKTAYRFTTTMGYINVGMNTKATAATVGNFKHYADEAAWDTTFFHRSTRDAKGGIQVVQGGGFNINAGGNIGSVHAHAGIGLQLGVSNTRGTIAMARTTDPNSATNQWFFNVNDNAVLDTVGGGYTVFGSVMDTSSQATLNAINNLTIRQGDPGNQNSPFNELPSTDATGPIDVPADLVLVTRVAMLMDQAAPTAPRTTATSTPPATPAARAPSTSLFAVAASVHKNVWDDYQL